uniref:Leucine-rich repeats and calponin homology (CH) domain containing 2 n=1 Tax=Acanthochromis polyacanthus TaxID=80966 RepID=A0A3Q1FL06_9TELE
GAMAECSSAWRAVSCGSSRRPAGGLETHCGLQMVHGLGWRREKKKGGWRRTGVQRPFSSLFLADLSKNRLTEIPPEVCLFAPLESLNLYHNCIKCIPEAIINLQMLTYLDISRNLLSVLPKYLFNLPLKVLLVSNNKLVSIPEEIGKAKELMELDVSCNEIQVLPAQVGRLQALRELNIRKNCLHMLPEELADLPLIRLDFSCNKITEIPPAYRKLRQLQHIILDNNPMQSPPAQICLKGKVHIFKYLNIQACRMDKKPDTLDLPSLGKRCLPQPLTDRYRHICWVLFQLNDTFCTLHLCMYHIYMHS